MAGGGSCWEMVPIWWVCVRGAECGGGGRTFRWGLGFGWVGVRERVVARWVSVSQAQDGGAWWVGVTGTLRRLGGGSGRLAAAPPCPLAGGRGDQGRRGREAPRLSGRATELVTERHSAPASLGDAEQLSVATPRHPDKKINSQRRIKNLVSGATPTSNFYM